MARWWVIEHEALTGAMRRCHRGEEPDVVLRQLLDEAATEVYGGGGGSDEPDGDPV